jgi:L-alanine-DL-glutamate epimerase-like enolase superfamily enzyme
MSRSVTARVETWAISGQFTISRDTKRSATVVVVEISEQGSRGLGESVPYRRYGETVDSVLDSVKESSALIAEGASREDLLDILPAGAARNALDCAMWDLESKVSGRRAWELAGMDVPLPAFTAFTLSLDDPVSMGRAARRRSEARTLKLKLGIAEEDLQRVEAVAKNAPEATLIVDANEGWTVEEYIEISPRLSEIGVALIEQPLPSENDHILASLERPVPLCADESVHDRSTLDAIATRYDTDNVKLDKTGGLTEGLEFVRTAATLGLDLMVGSMVATSLALAPATLLTPHAKWVDLDGPLLLERDRPHGLTYEGYLISPPSQDFWG